MGFATLISNFRNILRPLDRPIFLVGCARSGTTALAAPFYFHPDVGPKSGPIHDDLPNFIEKLMDYEKHLDLARFLERKPVYFNYFRQIPNHPDISREYIVREDPRGPIARAIFKARLKRHLNERRLLGKTPENIFRVEALRKIFPDAKFICIHRDGRDVVSSWGLRHKGFDELGIEKGIRFYTEKWNETIDHAFDVINKVPIYVIRYEDLVDHPAKYIREMMEFVELDHSILPLEKVQFHLQVGQWKKRIPAEYHPLLHEKLERNLRRLNYL